MLPEELRRRVRQIEFTTRKRVDDVLSGSYRSSFKGQGVTFAEHRQYVPGDDIRHIDWKVSARTRDPLVKKYEEERELGVLLVVDGSASGLFGSDQKLKEEVAAEIAGMIAYAATHTGDKVGLLLFAGEIEKIIPPRKGRGHVQRLIREVLGFRGKTKGTDLTKALEGAGRLLKHAGIVFVVSDFRASGYDIPLKRLARKHDVIAMKIGDPRETDFPSLGVFRLVDPESGAEAWVDSGSYRFRTWLKESHEEFKTDTATAFKGGKVDCLELSTGEDYAEAVVRFFAARARRIRA